MPGRLAWLLLLAALSLGRAEYLLTTSPNKVEIGITEQLTLDCSFRGDPSSTQLHSITRVRILKEINPDDFQIVAEARDFDSDAVNMGLGPSANVSGLIGDVASSYLSVHWGLVTSGVLGRYRCDVVGFKANQDVFIERSSVLVLKESNVTVEDVIGLIIEQKAELEKQLQDQKLYCDNRLAVVESGIDARLEAIKAEQENSSQEFHGQLLQLTAGLGADVTRLMETGVLQYWPQGSYGLLMPDTGCPNSAGAIWESGLAVIHTESTDRNYDEVSPNSHHVQPILQRVGLNNFVNQHFCVSSAVSPGAEWPSGAYCINRAGNVCPNGFSSGYVSWLDETTGSQASASGKLPDGTYTTNQTTIDYCCRNDGAHETPVFLPRSRPFYLYRYNGTCQQVTGMQAAAEYIVFDTDSLNEDAYENAFHPDGTINNVRIELCYYKET